MNYREPTRAEWVESIIYLAVYAAAIAVGGFLLLPLGNTGILLWAVIAAGGLSLLVWWHSRSVGYRCANCGHEFEISILTDLISPHGMSNGGWQYVKCPHCGQRTRAKILVKDNSK